MAKHIPVKLTLNTNIIYRVAQLPTQASLEESWPQLKESIRLSSPAFYAEIEYLAAKVLQNLNEKKKYALQKYFNQARFRATLYGTFASVGIFNNTELRWRITNLVVFKQVFEQYKKVILQAKLLMVSGRL